MIPNEWDCLVNLHKEEIEISANVNNMTEHVVDLFRQY